MALPIRIVLREGFRGHDVLVAIDGREVFRWWGHTSDTATSRLRSIDVLCPEARTHVEVFARPGDLASLDVDVSTYRALVIDLVGTATVSFETHAVQRCRGLQRTALPSETACAPRCIDDHENGRVR